MARSSGQAPKLLLLKDYLEHNTDEAHPATTAALTAYLAENGVSVERKTIYSDLETLSQFGMDILRAGGKNGGWYLGSREFELPELKLLVDAVQSCRFLSERKSLALIRKLETLASRHEAGTLRRQVVVTGRVKSMNESIYYNVDLLHQAIAENSQIRFRYFEWGVDKQRQYRGGPRTASPYTLVWDNENYYLVAHTEAHGLTHFRVDKMAEITLTGEKRVETDETRAIDPRDYGRQVFQMYHGQAQTVRLRFENALSGVVIDRFGKDVFLVPDGPDHFTMSEKVSVSPVFLGWLLSFGNRVQILSPQSVIDAYTALCRQVLGVYAGEEAGAP